MAQNPYFCIVQHNKILNNTPLLRIAFMLVLGIAVGDHCGAGVAAWLWLCVAGAVLAGALASGPRRPTMQGAGILLTVMLMGAALVSHRNSMLRFNFPDHALRYEAVVSGEPQVRGKTLQCELTVTRIGSTLLVRPIRVQAAILRDTIRHRWRQLRVGDGIRAHSFMEPLTGITTGSHFDYVRWLHVHGVVARTFVYHSHWQQSAIDITGLSVFDRARLQALRWRHRMLDMYRSLGLGRQHYAVVAAMTLGDKSSLSRHTKDLYATAGASHVLALSGLHLGIIYAILTLLMGGGRRWRWLAQGIILTAIWTYVVLVGMPASVIRSATMLTICSVCLVLQRQQASVNTLAFAAIVMLLANPLNLWDVGFQMSFMAVLAIMVYYRSIYYLLPLRHRLTRWAWGMASVSIAAQLGTAPLVMYYFGRFSSYFLLTNFIVIPAATIILYGAVAMVLAMPVLALQQYIAKALAFVAEGMNSALAWTTTLPGADISNLQVSTLQLVLIYVVIASFTVVADYVRKVWEQEKLEGFY